LRRKRKVNNPTVTNILMSSLNDQLGAQKISNKNWEELQVPATTNIRKGIIRKKLIEQFCPGDVIQNRSRY